jgi:hypothetical protein
VFQKRRNKSDGWDSAAPAYGRYWKDVPGLGRRREHIPLGICRTRLIAQRKCARHIEKLGLNSTRNFIESTSTTTFGQQAEIWLKSLAIRKRDPVEQTTVDNRRYALDKWILPAIEQKHIAEVNNLTLKTLVDSMAVSLAPSTIRDYANIVKAVVASALDESGEQKFPRKWNPEFIDAPLVRNQRQSSTDGEGVTSILNAASGQYRMLYALLAGCGPMRVGEALGLEINKHISPDFRTIYIRQKAKRGLIQPYLKTENGEPISTFAALWL